MATEVDERELLTTQSLGVNAVTQAMVKAGILEKAVLPFPYRQEIRYLLGRSICWT